MAEDKLSYSAPALEKGLDILELLARSGRPLGTRQIAEELHLSIKTIESHRAHIKEKLNLRNATELVQHAIQWREA